MNKFIYRFFIVSIPLLGAVLANILSGMHLKHFCLIKLLTGHECWGCGLTRAFAALSRFDFQQAYNYNHLIVIFAPLLLILWLCLLRKEFRYNK